MKYETATKPADRIAGPRAHRLMSSSLPVPPARRGFSTKEVDKKSSGPELWVSRGLHSESGGGRGLTARMLSLLFRYY